MSCPECFQGSVHDGEPRGKVIKLHGLDTYATEPADGRAPRGIIVIVPDAFGWEFVNNRILADHYADKGDYKVYLPDFMLGHSASLSMLQSVRGFTSGSLLYKPYYIVMALSGFIPFRYHNRFGRSWPIVESFFRQLRTDGAEGAALPVGVAGFCWGGKHAVLLAQTSETAVDGRRPLIDAAFTGHPSRLALPADIAALTRPVSFAIPEKDNQVSPEQAAMIRGIVEALPAEAKGEVVVYEDCAHGFCVRADLKFKDSEVARQAAEAEDQCIAWFNAKLGLAA
ncbi:Alpha/Beta hydrolase protein [Podospora appendiculata]|uniref:Alpha/Beta hydrolase protein n=1 Tax=Podospora appendiculata TaxID=314037 RepID=A0AAE0X0Y7_9PEZI|nr:Alpha/Beta hydrolase protein [Podospora appendiculata]